MSRKRNLVDHGFRLPSAMDNRPLRWEEFLDRIGQTVYLSATPGDYEIAKGGGIDNVVEQIIRPTGLVDPQVIVKPTKGQIDDLMGEIHAGRAQRARPRHDADQEDVRGPHRLPPRERHPHALPPLRGRHPQAHRAAARPAARRVRRAGRHQPAARGPRPARGVAGRDPRRRQGRLPALRQVADPDDRPRGAQRVRPGRHVRRQDDASMEKAIDETNRRRDKQIAYNQAHGVDPQPLRKKIADITEMLAREDARTPRSCWRRGGQGKRQSRRRRSRAVGRALEDAGADARRRRTPVQRPRGPRATAHRADARRRGRAPVRGRRPPA